MALGLGIRCTDHSYESTLEQIRNRVGLRLEILAYKKAKKYREQERGLYAWLAMYREIQP
jgi:hypothetical protein